MLQEELQYRLTNEAIHIHGATLTSSQQWSRFYQMKETNTFFLFYQGPRVATLIAKEMFTESTLEEFKEFVASLQLKKG